MLEVRLLTGRNKVTVRAVAADGTPAAVRVEIRRPNGSAIQYELVQAGFPVVGDRKYGSSRPFAAGIALHSRRLAVEHPVSKIKLEIEAPLPASWQRYLRAGLD